MQTRPLGNSDLMITRLGLGAWAIGGDWAFGWGPQDDRESIAVIHEALDLGINWIDTAAVYGLGHSEEIVAEALAGIAQRPYVFTKCERVWNEKREVGHSLKAESIRRECEESLKRLKIDVIDLYQIHWPEPPEDIEEGWETLVNLKQEGKVRWIGVSNFNVAQMQRILPLGLVTSLQPPYSMLRREVEAEILPFTAQQGIGVITYSPMASGMLSGKMTRDRIAALPRTDWRLRNKQYQEPQLTWNLELVEALRTIGGAREKSPAELAIAWVLRHPSVTGAIVGARHPGQVREFIGAANEAMTDEDYQEINTLLPPRP